VAGTARRRKASARSKTLKVVEEEEEEMHTSIQAFDAIACEGGNLVCNLVCLSLQVSPEADVMTSDDFADEEDFTDALPGEEEQETCCKLATHR